MNALFFLIGKTLKNIVRAAFKKPGVLIGYIFIILFFGAMIYIALAMPSGFVRKSDPALFRGIAVLVFTFLYYTTLKLGIDKGSSYFRLADVNLAFTSPLRPNQILLYGFIKQLGGALFLLCLALFQIPNLKNNFVMTPYGIPAILLAVASFALSFPLISMIIYSWASVTKERKRIAKRILDAAALLAALIFIFDLTRTKDFTASLINIFDSSAAHYFPVIGWTGAIASSAVSGISAPFIVGVSGMVIIFAGLSVLLYKMNLDYYEDVLEATEYAEAALKAKREGRNVMFNQKVKANVRQKLSGTGAGAIFAKSILELRKTSMFLFFDRISVTVILSSIIFNLVMPPEAREFSLPMILAFSLYMLAIMQMQGRWPIELGKPYIFLIPAEPAAKLFYATLAEHMKNLFDGTILFVLSGIFFSADYSVVIACIITYTLIGAVYTYSEVLARRLFGSTHSKGLNIFVKIIFAMLLLVPAAVSAGIVIAFTKSQFLAVCAAGAWGLVLAVTLFVCSSGIFKNLEAAS